MLNFLRLLLLLLMHVVVIIIIINIEFSNFKFLKNRPVNRKQNLKPKSNTMMMIMSKSSNAMMWCSLWLFVDQPINQPNQEETKTKKNTDTQHALMHNVDVLHQRWSWMMTESENIFFSFKKTILTTPKQLKQQQQVKVI